MISRREEEAEGEEWGVGRQEPTFPQDKIQSTTLEGKSTYISPNSYLYSKAPRLV